MRFIRQHRGHSAGGGFLYRGGFSEHFTKDPADVLDHATSEIAIGFKLGIDTTKKLAGEGFKRNWPPIIRMDEAVKAKFAKGAGN